MEEKEWAGREPPTGHSVAEVLPFGPNVPQIACYLM